MVRRPDDTLWLKHALHEQVALDVFAVLFLSKIIEPIYGSKEYLKFTLLVSLMAGVTAFTSLILAYMFGPRLGFILCGCPVVLHCHSVETPTAHYILCKCQID